MSNIYILRSNSLSCEISLRFELGRERTIQVRHIVLHVELGYAVAEHLRSIAPTATASGFS